MLRERFVASLLALALVTTVLNPGAVLAASAVDIDRNVDAALARLFATAPDAKELAARAKGVLVFPNIVKAGFMFGGQYGEGALRRKGKTVAYYNSLAASYGWQAGAQTFGYVLFFMTDAALKYLDTTEGFEVGTGPSVVVLDQGMAKAFTTTTVQSDVYAVIFAQTGLMAGVGVQGSKISRIDR